jgi:hypothetical protein
MRAHTEADARLARAYTREVAAVTPRLVEESVLVIVDCKDASGTEWKAGDRASLRRRAVREAVKAQPSWFAMEYETTDVDLDLIRRLDEQFEADFERVKRERAETGKRREKALRAELAEQERGQPDLERRYAKQEKERAEREKRALEERERQQIESALASGDRRRVGFHWQ